MSDRSFIIDDDLFEAGLEGYAKEGGGHSNVWRLKSGEPRKGYFLHNPGDDAKNAGDWVKYREISAFEGLRGGVEMPNGLKEFPVFDQVMVRDEETGKTLRTTRTSNDPLIALVVPGKFAKNGKAKASDVMSINFVEVITDDEGEIAYRHIILKLGSTASKQLLNMYRTQQELADGEFDMTAFPWTLNQTGQGSSIELKMKPHRKEGPIDLDEFESINVTEMLEATRAQVEDFVEQVKGGGERKSADATADDDDEEEITLGGGLTEDDDDDEDDLSAEDKYAGMTDGRIRKALKAKDVEIPPKASRTQLISLAVKHLD